MVTRMSHDAFVYLIGFVGSIKDTTHAWTCLLGTCMLELVTY